MNSRTLSVLVVEDKDDVADSTAELLAVLGHDVRVARCGEDGLHAALAATPDLVLLDIGLPGMSGWEVARRLRALTAGRQPLVVAVTGYGAEPDRWQSADAGIDLHLVKPVAPRALTDLLAWVGACLDGSAPPPMRGLIRMCAWCQRVFANGQWRIAEPGNFIAVTHAMCPVCFDGAVTALHSAAPSR